LINCLACIDLNPLRAGLVDRPEEYRWNSLGYHIQTGNKDNFLSLDFGLKEFGVLDGGERLKGYRRYVYKAGAVDRSKIGKRKIIEEAVVEKERKKEFKISRVDRFRYRTRYFTDSGIIGTKEFVSINYKRFKDIFMSKREKVPKPVAGLDGVYSLKRLSEMAFF
jgi:putative transposase